MPVDEGVDKGAKKTTGHSIINNVSSNKSKVQGDFKYKVRNNFN